MVERMSVQCGGFLRTLSLRDCQSVEDAALRFVEGGTLRGGSGRGSRGGWDRGGSGRGSRGGWAFSVYFVVITTAVACIIVKCAEVKMRAVHVRIHTNACPTIQ